MVGAVKTNSISNTTKVEHRTSRKFGQAAGIGFLAPASNGSFCMQDLIDIRHGHCLLFSCRDIRPHPSLFELLGSGTLTEIAWAVTSSKGCHLIQKKEFGIVAL